MHFLDILENPREAPDYLSVLHVTSYSNKALPHIIGFNVARNIIHANIIASLLGLNCRVLFMSILTEEVTL